MIKDIKDCMNFLDFVQNSYNSGNLPKDHQKEITNNLDRIKTYSEQLAKNFPSTNDLTTPQPLPKGIAEVKPPNLHNLIKLCADQMELCVNQMEYVKEALPSTQQTRSKQQSLEAAKLLHTIQVRCQELLERTSESVSSPKTSKPVSSPKPSSPSPSQPAPTSEIQQLAQFGLNKPITLYVCGTSDTPTADITDALRILDIHLKNAGIEKCFTIDQITKSQALSDAKTFTDSKGKKKEKTIPDAVIFFQTISAARPLWNETQIDLAKLIFKKSTAVDPIGNSKVIHILISNSLPRGKTSTDFLEPQGLINKGDLENFIKYVNYNAKYSENNKEIIRTNLNPTSSITHPLFCVSTNEPVASDEKSIIELKGLVAHLKCMLRNTAVLQNQTSSQSSSSSSSSSSATPTPPQTVAIPAPVAKKEPPPAVTPTPAKAQPPAVTPAPAKAQPPTVTPAKVTEVQNKDVPDIRRLYVNFESDINLELEETIFEKIKQAFRTPYEIVKMTNKNRKQASAEERKCGFVISVYGKGGDASDALKHGKDILEGSGTKSNPINKRIYTADTESAVTDEFIKQIERILVSRQ